MISQLKDIYNDVVGFEKRVRTSVGTDISAHVPVKRANDIVDRMLDVFGVETDEAKLTHIRLIDEVLSEAGKTYPIEQLSILWPSQSLTANKVNFLKQCGCVSLALIAENALKRSKSRLPPSNKL